mgnify:CR=1 FL=1
MDKRQEIAVLFPGQASQYVGMGKEFIERIPECAGIVREGEKITSLPLMDRIMNGPIEDLTRTLICQPAVFAISMVCWHVYRKAAPVPFAVAGHSLGEYSALVASGVITMDEGYYIIKKRAQIMDSISAASGGSMLAVIGMKLADLEHVLADFPGVEIANMNSDSQIVVGGRKDILESFNLYLRQKKVKGIMLNVSGPFHTSLMEKAGELISGELAKLDFKDPDIPLYLNYSGSRARDGGEVKEGLVRQISSPVRWLDIVRGIYGEGCRVFVEVGPKKVLKKIVEGIVPDAFVMNLEDEGSLGLLEDFLKNRQES